MDMDFILPDDLTTEKMRLEYEKILAGRDSSALSLGVGDGLNGENDTKKSTDFSEKTPHTPPCQQHTYPSTNILVLYFMFALGYNCGYGTSIFDTNISMGRLQSQERPTGIIDGFFKRKE